MTFDAVHDLQTAFRGLLEAFSFPGRAVDLSAQASRLGPWLAEGDAVPALALALAAATLVDQEAAYAVTAEGALSRFLVDWSAHRPGALEKATIVAVPAFVDRDLATVVSSASAGTLTDPHLGATILVGVEDLDQGTTCTLKGPGIETTTVRTLPTGAAWVAARAERIGEFPLGVDLAFFDRKGRVVALPRTTRLTVGKEA